MASVNNSIIKNLMLGASVVAMTNVSGVASAQTSQAAEVDEIVVTGIRSSLKDAMNIKRDAAGIVDAISAEDIGKFPDTNLAESLQRVTGISIDRALGEGSTVTARGFGADYNLVTFNGRTMPTSTLGDGASAPSSRSFDFGNIASEAIASVEVYKTSRADVQSGGIGATINIKTTKPLEAPGMAATVGIKGVYDLSQIEDSDLTPEISGLYSNTFADGKFGVAVSGSYQKRNGGVTQANVDWRDGYAGDESNWGSLPPADSWNVINRPGDDDVYAVPQNANYALTDFSRERVNGQLVLQYEPVENLRATLDYTYSANEVESERNSAGIWYNHGSAESSWTDGPVAGIVYYTEYFGATDLSYEGSLVKNRSENKSLGANIAWQPTDRLSLELDAHSSTAESAPNGDFGSSMAIGTTVAGVSEQMITFLQDLPVISYVGGANDLDPEDVSVRQISGSAFRTAKMDSEVNQIQFGGTYDANLSFIDSVDFGASFLENQIESSYGFLQSDTWGGIATADDVPDDLFEWVSLPDKFEGVSGVKNPNFMQGFYTFDVQQMADLAETLDGVCSSPWLGTPVEGTCFAVPTEQNSLAEETASIYVQARKSFDINAMPANIQLGARYEETTIETNGLSTPSTGVIWTTDTDVSIQIADTPVQGPTFEGSYDFFLPSFDFDIQPTDDIVLRASASQTIARQTYDNLFGTLSIAPNARVEQADGNVGNPSLLPFLSTNFDVSAEWYYGNDSYVSVGYFSKDVENYTGSGTYVDNFYGLTNPFYGPRANAARDAGFTDAGDIRQYIIDNFTDGVELQLDGSYHILGLAEDDLLDITVDTTDVSDQSAPFTGWEFAVQHNIGDSGFGFIGNFTIADNEFEYDNTLPHTETQFALVGVSNSANVIGYYDKNGLQARVAYNWRDEFLSGNGNNPFYTEAYGQVDASASYDVSDQLTVFAEGINILGADRRGHRRSGATVTFMNPQDGRFAAGARYKF